MSSSLTMEQLGLWMSKSFLWVVLLLGFCCFLPLFGDVDDVTESSLLHSSLTSDAFRGSSYVMIPLSFIYIVDFMMDWFSSDEIDVKQQKSRAYLLDGQEILVFQLGILIVPIISYLNPDTTSSLALIYVCASRCQITLMTGFVMHTCHRHYSTYFPAIITQFVVVGVGFVSIAQVFAIAEIRDVTPFRWGLFYVLAVLGFIILICFIRWTYSIFLIKFLFPRLTKYLQGDVKNGANDVSSLRMAHTERSVYFPLSYVLSSIIYMIVTLLISSGKDMLDYSATDLLYLNLPLLFFQLCMTLLASQLAKFEAIEFLYELLEAKKSYVRYISHELRTPLNTSCLGLNMLLEEMSTLANGMTPDEKDRFDVISDINIACITAVDILNDLLCFEKLDSGPLELHKEEIPALKFVKDCVSMFGVHARSKEITIIIDYAGKVKSDGLIANAGNEMAVDDVVEEEEEKYLLNDRELISLDKFKMSQVIRNLVSNALKFTPRGGIVTVRVHFVPGGEMVLLEKSEDIHDDRQFSMTSMLISSSKKIATNVWNTFKIMMNTRNDNIRNSRVLATHQDVLLHENDENLNHVDLPRKGSTLVNRKLTRDQRRRSSAFVARKPPIHGDIHGSGFVHGRLVVEVIDTGAGISEENQRRLFHEVVQFSPEKLQAGGGSGLGLMITKGIVDRHLGTIAVHSKGEGLGSCFTMTIPMRWEGTTMTTGSFTEGHSIEQIRNPLRVVPSLQSFHSKSGKSGKSGKSIPSEKSIPFKKDMTVGGGGVENKDPLLFPMEDTSLLMDTKAVTEDEMGMISSMQAISTEQNRQNIPRIPVRNELPELRLRPIDKPATPLDLPCMLSSETKISSYRLLIVDDSQMSRKMLTRVMKSQGYVCEEAENGQQAVDIIKNILSGIKSGGNFDCILMDFMMPILDGPSATKEIRTLGYRGKIFAVTGNVLPHDIDHFIASGANLVLTKPLNIDVFKEEMLHNDDDEEDELEKEKEEDIKRGL